MNFAWKPGQQRTTKENKHMFKAKFSAILMLAGLAALAAPAVHASLIGDTVGCNITGGGSFTCDTSTATVQDPGNEFFVGGGQFISVDIASSTISLDFLVTGSLGATIINLTGLDWVDMPLGEILDVQLTSNSGVIGLDAGDLTFGAHNVSINLIDTEFQAGASALITLVTSHTVPVTGILPLLGLGIVSLGLARRRRKH
jgi:uncharacterized protein (TIGR03382 family)